VQLQLPVSKSQSLTTGATGGCKAVCCEYQSRPLSKPVAGSACSRELKQGDSSKSADPPKARDWARLSGTAGYRVTYTISGC
jgi:hypothetical protein